MVMAWMFVVVWFIVMGVGFLGVWWLISGCVFCFNCVCVGCWLFAAEFGVL